MLTSNRLAASVAVAGFALALGACGGSEPTTPLVTPAVVSVDTSGTEHEINVPVTSSPTPDTIIVEPNPSPDDVRPSAQPSDAAGIPADVDDTVEFGLSVEVTRYGTASAGFVSVGGVVVGIVEDDGVCTVIATGANGAATEASGPAARSADAMSCGEGLEIDVTALSSPVSLVLTYSSPLHEGASEPVEVTP